MVTIFISNGVMCGWILTVIGYWLHFAKTLGVLLLTIVLEDVILEVKNLSLVEALIIAVLLLRKRCPLSSCWIAVRATGIQ